jgi:hypothetical protein
MNAVVGYNKSCEKYNSPLHSQGKLTTPRRENQKIQQQIEILKANEWLHKV